MNVVESSALPEDFADVAASTFIEIAPLNNKNARISFEDQPDGLRPIPQQANPARAVFLDAEYNTPRINPIDAVIGARVLGCKYIDLDSLRYEDTEAARTLAQMFVGNDDTPSFFEETLRLIHSNPDIMLKHIVVHVIDDEPRYFLGFTTPEEEAKALTEEQLILDDRARINQMSADEVKADEAIAKDYAKDIDMAMKRSLVRRLMRTKVNLLPTED